MRVCFKGSQKFFETLRDAASMAADGEIVILQNKIEDGDMSVDIAEIHLLPSDREDGWAVAWFPDEGENATLDPWLDWCESQS